MPVNFYLIVTGQLIIFLGVYWNYRKGNESLVKLFSISALFGLLFGASFDIIFGILGSFTYVTNLPNASITPWGLTLFQLVINGIFSYGILVATAYFFVPNTNPIGKHVTKKILTILSLLTITAATLVVVFVGPGLISLFASGVVILTASELLLILRLQAGPFLSFLLKRNYKTLLRMWLQIVLLGFMLEILNYFFPFWVFLPGLGYNHFLLETLIVLFGYIVLMHPMIIFWQIIKSKKLV